MRRLFALVAFLVLAACGAEPAYAQIVQQGGAPNVSQATGTLPVANGGTGTTAGAAGPVLLQMFGDGHDGPATISGALTLTRDMYYTNLTISSGAVIQTVAYRIFVSGTLDITAAPAGAFQLTTTALTGGNGSAATGGTAASPATTPHSIGSNSVGASGKTGTSAAGTQASAVTAQMSAMGVFTGATGAAGGTGTNAGGAVQAGATTTNPQSFPVFPRFCFDQGSAGTIGCAGAGQGGQGGSAGGGDGTGLGGGGGAAGGSPGIIFISANTINRGTGTAVGTFNSVGGAGGIGGIGSGGTNRGGGGGGGGGSGGLVFISYLTLTGTATTLGPVDVTGGQGGAGGAGTGSGTGGDGGGAGPSGQLWLYKVDTGVLTKSTQNPAIAGNAHSSGTGGAIKAATTTQLNF